MYLVIVFGSLCNTLLISFLGFFLGRQAVIYCCISTLLVLSSLVIFSSTEILLNNNTIVIQLYKLFLINDIQVDIAFLFDQLTILMLLVVLLISTFVHIFTNGYMSHDPYIVRFYAFLGFFTFFMIVLVTSDNFLQLFVGWEGVGVCSYLLINFWYNRIMAGRQL
jgi:NADH-ubiquinone oxidoreductase chain 5